MYLSTISSRLLLYDTHSWDLKKTYSCYDGILRDISWSDDSKYLLQVNAKGLVEILSATENDVRSLQHIPLKDTWSANFHRDGHRNIAIGTRSGNVLIWDTKNKSITKTFPTPTHQSSVNHISYNAKNTSLAATMHNGDTIIYGLVSNIPVLTVKLPYSKSISVMKFHHESRSLLGLATDEGHVVLRDISTNKDKVFFENVHGSPVSDFAYSLVNRDVMLSSGFDKIMNVYDVRLQNVVSSIRTSFTLTSMTINVDNQVALGTKGGIVLLYDLRELSTPLKILKGHEEEVRKVAFQPLRRKLTSTEISLREENDAYISPEKSKSPTKFNRNSDMFFANNTPPRNSMKSPNPSCKDDSFLVLMGLDKSNVDLDQDECTMDRRNEKYDRFNQLEINTEKDISNTSTPLHNNNNVPEIPLKFSTPICENGVSDDKMSTEVTQKSNEKLVADMKDMEELKDFIKLNVADMADDSRNYFLHIMMALTKQKLYLEKQMSAVHEQMRTLVENQNMLVETNRKLVLEIDQLKKQNKFF